jgi:hypothetical protein
MAKGYHAAPGSRNVDARKTVDGKPRWRARVTRGGKGLRMVGTFATKALAARAADVALVAAYRSGVLKVIRDVEGLRDHLNYKLEGEAAGNEGGGVR